MGIAPAVAGLALFTMTATLWSLPAGAAFILTDGEFEYAQRNDTGTFGSSNLRGAFGTGPDNLYEDWWLYRLAGDGAETEFPVNPIPTSSTANSAVVDFAFNPAFSAMLAYALTDLGDGRGAVRQDMTIVNETLSDLSIDLFYYVDLDVGGGADNTATQPDRNRILFAEGGARFTAIGSAAQAFQVTAFSDLQKLLLDSSITNLDNTDVPFGPGDATAGFQWSLLILTGGSATVTSAIGIGDFDETDINPAPLPVPSTLALLALSGLALRLGRSVRST